MSLEKVSSIFKEARKKNIGVIAIDTFNLESIAWLIEVAQEENLPIIQMLYPTMNSHIPFKVYADIVVDLAKNASVPIGLHLDHCSSFETIVEAIKSGFKSVMIDGSQFSFDENVAMTKEIVKVAHAFDVDVEAELGMVGKAFKESDFSNNEMYTKVEDAVEFVKKTNVDSLAIAIGSAHGNYVKTPKLDFNRLEDIHANVDVPLVLHGGSGIPDEQIRKAFSKGISKLNVGTEYFQTFYDKTFELTQKNKDEGNYIKFIMSDLKEEMKIYLKNKLQIVRY